MSELILRPHQITAYNMIKKSLSTNQVNSNKRIRRVLVAAACAFGKTVLAAHIMQSAAANGKRVMFIADRVKLIDQTVATLDRYGIDCGVQQAQHPRCAPWKPIQIASVQTLQGRGRSPDADIFIIDEAHTTYAHIIDLMISYNNCIFIGLTATPYSRGMGNIWQDMVVPVTTRELLEQGYLCPIEYYGGHKVDMTNVRTSSGEWRQSDLEQSIEKDEVLSGDIVKNWEAHSNGGHLQTIAFTPSIKHSKGLVELFNEHGISAEHIDCHTSIDDRQALYDAHDRGEFCILSCSQLLNTGYDAPGVECLIDCYPVKSVITYVQRVGRIMRTAEGKHSAIYLDHAGNVERHGFIEDIVPDHLDDKDKKETQDSLTKDKAETEVKLKDCPRCYQSFTGFSCACGFEVPNTQRLAHDGTKLINLKPDKPLSKMTAAEKRNHLHTSDQKDTLKSELMRHAFDKDHKEGWVWHKYKEYYGVAPSKYQAVPMAGGVSTETKKWLQSLNIRRAKSKVA